MRRGLSDPISEPLDDSESCMRSSVVLLLDDELPTFPLLDEA